MVTFLLNAAATAETSGSASSQGSMMTTLITFVLIILIFYFMRQQGYCFIEANKVCSSPIKREKAVLRLAQRCDAVIIVGGKNSANTKMLADLAATSGKPVWHIENAQEVNDEMRSFGTIGIASGTSTSMETILRVKAKLLGRLREDRKKPIS